MAYLPMISGGGAMKEGSYPCENCSPIMTSNTAPSGTASASNSTSGFEPWRAMKGVDIANNDRWSASINVENAYIQYMYPSAVVINRVEFKLRAESRRTADTAHDCQIKIQGSNDGSTFTDLGVFDEYATDADYIKIHVLDNTTAYKYYRMQYVGYNVIYNNGHYCGMALLRLYYQNV